MNPIFEIIKTSIVVICIASMLFSCTNDSKEVRDFLAEKNLPIAVAKNAYHVHKDSGKITSRLIAPLMKDFQNRKYHPYREFPNGIKIINYKNNGRDSVTVLGDYALSYEVTSISEIKGNVVIINHTEKTRLETSQLFWDQKNEYFFTEKKFILMKLTDTTRGIGFESKKNLSMWVAKKTTGEGLVKE